MAKDHRIRLGPLVQGLPHDMAGQYIVSYDPDYHLDDGDYDGGALICTRNPNEAGRFELTEAVNLWMSGPKCACHRLRADGEPNRPLVAFCVEITQVPLAQEEMSNV